jgi:hypothetical protein
MQVSLNNIPHLAHMGNLNHHWGYIHAFLFEPEEPGLFLMQTESWLKRNMFEAPENPWCNEDKKVATGPSQQASLQSNYVLGKRHTWSRVSLIWVPNMDVCLHTQPHGSPLCTPCQASCLVPCPLSPPFQLNFVRKSSLSDLQLSDIPFI